ncbi:uncharacterized protein LOC129313710 [Prosopis cineraria]|uniref:uncharacterized protein LOC129313710 n=1 Tax=Prosopis cineraria TaxID=364024 RepID=UPI00240EA5EF|nr:uncharacterized protein LOC129313710 [Prosopis cineraria]
MLFLVGGEGHQGRRRTNENEIDIHSDPFSAPCDIVGDISYEELQAAAYEDAKHGMTFQSIVFPVKTELLRPQEKMESPITDLVKKPLGNSRRNIDVKHLLKDCKLLVMDHTFNFKCLKCFKLDCGGVHLAPLTTSYLLLTRFCEGNFGIKDQRLVHMLGEIQEIANK